MIDFPNSSAPKCGHSEVVDVPIHDGTDIRRDCGRCGTRWAFHAGAASMPKRSTRSSAPGLQRPARGMGGGVLGSFATSPRTPCGTQYREVFSRTKFAGKGN